MCEAGINIKVIQDTLGHQDISRKVQPTPASGSDRWYLGPKNRDVGSIHSDYMIASAADLCEINHIAIYPVIGWWRERSYLGKCNSKIRYSLVVSLSTPQEKVDLYTPIISQIKVPVETAIHTG